MPKKDEDGNNDMSTSTTSTTTPSRPKNSGLYALIPSKEAKRWMKRYRTEIAAGSSSVLSTFAAFPLDFAKSRMQSYSAGFVHTIKDAYKAEGLRAFWRGVGAPLISVTVVRTVSFSLYQRAKYTYDRWIQAATGRSPLVIANDKHATPNIYTVSCFGAAGATAGAIITIVSCPFELCKLHAQLAGKMAREAAPGTSTGQFNAMGAYATARQIVGDRGFRGLYAGYKMHLVRDTIGTAIYFMTYESIKQLLGNARGNEPTSPNAVIIAGGMCGIIYPIDVSKTLYQKALLANKPGPEPVVRPDIRFFQMGSYRGLGVSIIRSCLINMIFFSNFEMVKKRINGLDVD
ncbi:hypothetical protein LTR66_012885 [Elasticomyces elasticus]|nr:hypothetical protein LTR66_012885 [Elasticomyces elasticus]KAK4985156.1 hypothetical protein LTR50_006155 [Elasticomyces elasticus]